MRSRSKVKEVVGSDYVLKFGKHKCKAIWWILVNDPRYIVWLVDNDVLSLSDGIYEEARDMDYMDELDNDYMFGDAGDIY